MVRPESNSRPPAWQPDAQPNEPPVRAGSVDSEGIHFLLFPTEPDRLFGSEFCIVKGLL